jgi:predicted transcriptional regulator
MSSRTGSSASRTRSKAHKAGKLASIAEKKRDPGDRVERALTIYGEWIAKILFGPKRWELRKGACNVRGRIGVVATGTKELWGTVKITNCFQMTIKELKKRDQFQRHQVPSAVLDTYFSGCSSAYVWELSEPETFTKPLSVTREPGMINWVPLSNAVQRRISEIQCCELPYWAGKCLEGGKIIDLDAKALIVKRKGAKPSKRIAKGRIVKRKGGKPPKRIAKGRIVKRKGAMPSKGIAKGRIAKRKGGKPPKRIAKGRIAKRKGGKPPKRIAKGRIVKRKGAMPSKGIAQARMVKRRGV